MTNSIENNLWVEKYRPKTVDDCILQKNIKNTFLGIRESGVIPNMLLSGPAGTGKTSVAKALCNDLNCEVLFINGSSERNIELIRTKLTNFCSTISIYGEQKVVIIDEADYLNSESTIPALRSFIEAFSNNARFIFTCNYPDRFMDAIKSRFANIDFTIPKEEKIELVKQLFMRLSDILRKEGVDFDKVVLGELIQRYFPDNRRIIGELQRIAIQNNNKITADALKNASSTVDDFVKAIRELNFTNAEKWINENLGLVNVNTILRTIYNNMREILKPDSIPTCIMLLDEYLDKSIRSTDPVITMSAFAIRCMSELEFKDGN